MNTIKSTFVTDITLTSPVLFLIFNRPETTQQVFSAIRKAKPPRLYVAADGPRSDYPNEDEKCEHSRKIATNVDWDCEVKTFFRENNLGCKLAASQAIDWFFEQELEGIILEDDCLPDQSFFWFCQELLNRYRDDTRIMHIGGTNFQFASANPMWRATLEILDFLPLANVDYSGGIITTDWYNEGTTSDESIKITVRFLTNEIRSDGIRIIVHKKRCNIQNKCTVKKISSALEHELQVAILKKAVLFEKEFNQGKKKQKRKIQN